MLISLTMIVYFYLMNMILILNTDLLQDLVKHWMKIGSLRKVCPIKFLTKTLMIYIPWQKRMVHWVENFWVRVAVAICLFMLRLCTRNVLKKLWLKRELPRKCSNSIRRDWKSGLQRDREI